MSDEQIEAKLAAYIDGALAPRERESVERLLADNPRHRRMVEEMKRAQGWLATLPRVKAPAELADGVDPGLERSALLGDDSAEDRGVLSRLLAPQMLALAATLVLLLSLVAAAIFLIPRDNRDELAGGSDPATPRAAQERPHPGEGGARPLAGGAEAAQGQNQSDDAAPEVAPTESGADQAFDADDRAGSGVEPDEVRDDAAERIDTSGSPVTKSRRNLLAQLDAVAEDAALLWADVESLPDASGLVAQFLTAAEAPIAGEQVQAADLPEFLRDRLADSIGQEVQIYIVDSMPRSQARSLLEDLVRVGRPVLVTSSDESAEGGPLAEGALVQTDAQGVERADSDLDGDVAQQALRIFPGDELSFVVTRAGDLPEEPTPGGPEIGRTTHFKLKVSNDGYVDLGEVGLGKTDVLGQELSALSELISARLAEDFSVQADIRVFHARRADIHNGRTQEQLEYLVVDREPVVPGTVLRIALSDGQIIDTVVGPDGYAAAGDIGDIEAGGLSVDEIQRNLRQRLATAKNLPRQENATPATRPEADGAAEPELSVINLSVRRHVDRPADAGGPLVIVLSTDTSGRGDWEGWGDEPAEADEPATRPAEAPAPDPATRPATGPAISPRR